MHGDANQGMWWQGPMGYVACPPEILKLWVF